VYVTLNQEASGSVALAMVLSVGWISLGEATATKYWKGGKFLEISASNSTTLLVTAPHHSVAIAYHRSRSIVQRENKKGVDPGPVGLTPAQTLHAVLSRHCSTSGWTAHLFWSFPSVIMQVTSLLPVFAISAASRCLAVGRQVLPRCCYGARRLSEGTCAAGDGGGAEGAGGDAGGAAAQVRRGGAPDEAAAAAGVAA
jgi:hypothetical protein